MTCCILAVLSCCTSSADFADRFGEFIYWWARLNARKWLCFVLSISSTVTIADPWVNPGDAVLRHHIQVLADTGIIKVPITSWPIMWTDIGQGVENVDISMFSEAQLQSFAYVRFAYERDSGGNAKSSLRAGIEGYGSNTRPHFSGFAVNQSEAKSVSFYADWLGDSRAAKLVVSVIEDPVDGSKQRFDGSYLASTWGNWSLCTGAVPRWWGPGWQDSLILSSNARSVPSISLQRNHADAFETHWLSWLGRWSLVAFIGRLEEDRTVPRAKLWGSRLTMKPFKHLELGFSQMALWGGRHRTESLSSFMDILQRENDFGVSQDSDDSTNSQIEAFDWRFSAPLTANSSWALYGQYANDVAEDDDGQILLVGLEASLNWRLGHTRGFLEAMDTGADGFKDELNPDIVYEHGAYTNGYRHRGLALAASSDNDSRKLTIGVDHYLSDTGQLSLRISKLELNKDSGNLGEPQGNTVVDSHESLYISRVSYVCIMGAAKISFGIKGIRKDADSSFDDHSSAYIRVNYRLL